jgi:hypothetical protein
MDNDFGITVSSSAEQGLGKPALNVLAIQGLPTDSLPSAPSGMLGRPASNRLLKKSP